MTLAAQIGKRTHSTLHVPVVIERAFGVSRSQARQFIRDGAFRIDGEPYRWLTCAVMDVDGRVLSLGRRKWARARVT